jgi:hypothetical protein
LVEEAKSEHSAKREEVEEYADEEFEDDKKV